MLTHYQNNALALTAEMKWLKEVIEVRIQYHFQRKKEATSLKEIPAPELSEYPSTYTSIIQHFRFDKWERLLILLALAPHVAPQSLDIFLEPNPKTNRPFTEFGGMKGTIHNGFLPTAETALFLLAEDDMMRRFIAVELFKENSSLRKANILQIGKPKAEDPMMSATIGISPEYLSLFTSGKAYKPDFSSNFPASRLTTKMEWEDLVLEHFIMREVQKIPAWLQHRQTILHEWGMDKRIQPGYRALFYGPPGTGKTLTASLIGKSLGVDVYRIDLSQVVSKYIGETEKNMANIFDQAQNKNWILFFDEADALFGKRTATSSSKDRHANQEVAYLLQRVERFPGIVILATNLKGNMDEAFARRFQSMIYFRMPNANQRLRLWKSAFAKQTPLAEDVDLFQIAQRYELSGGAINNVSRDCALEVLQRNNGDLRIFRDDIMLGIKKEYGKEGRTM